MYAGHANRTAYIHVSSRPPTVRSIQLPSSPARIEEFFCVCVGQGEGGGLVLDDSKMLKGWETNLVGSLISSYHSKLMFWLDVVNTHKTCWGRLHRYRDHMGRSYILIELSIRHSHLTSSDQVWLLREPMYTTQPWWNPVVWVKFSSCQEWIRWWWSSGRIYSTFSNKKTHTHQSLDLCLILSNLSVR